MLDKKRNQVAPESGRLGGKLVASLAVRCVKEELCSACFVDQRTDQRPEDWEHPGNGFYIFILMENSFLTSARG